MVSNYMSHENKLKSHLTLALLLLLSVLSVAEARPRRFMGRKEFLPYTRNLPAIDKIELFELKQKDDQWTDEILATRVFKGAEARKIASLWRGQNYNQHVSACHQPAYAIKFYAHDKLLVYASVCWSCNNIRFMTPQLDGEQNFAGGDKRGEQLSEVFRLAFVETR
jgi:hypothetical protein